MKPFIVTLAPPAKVRKKHKFRWTKKRAILILVLRSLKAFDIGTARTAVEIYKEALRLGGKDCMTIHDVKHYLYKDENLVILNYVKIAPVRWMKEVRRYYLSAKGCGANVKGR